MIASKSHCSGTALHCVHACLLGPTIYQIARLTLNVHVMYNMSVLHV